MRQTKTALVQVHVPTEEEEEEEQGKFSELLKKVLDKAPSYDIKLVIGDYNAKIDQRRHRMEQATRY